MNALAKAPAMTLNSNKPTMTGTTEPASVALRTWDTSMARKKVERSSLTGSDYCEVVSDSHAVRMSSGGLPSTVLPDEDPQFLAALDSAASSNDPHGELSSIVARHPRSSTGWAMVAQHGRTPLEQYAYFRVGYHRGLDALRQNGWRGSGFVRWAAPSNLGFLRCLLGLARAADAIGELDEAERCNLFLAQLDPSGTPAGE